MPTRRRRNQLSSVGRSLTSQASQRRFSQTSAATNAARTARAVATISQTNNRRYVNDPSGRYSGPGVFSRRTGSRVGTWVNLSH